MVAFAAVALLLVAVCAVVAVGIRSGVPGWKSRTTDPEFAGEQQDAADRAASPQLPMT